MTLKFDINKDDILAFQKQLSSRNQVFSRLIPIMIVLGIPAYVLISTNGNLEALYQWLPIIAGLIVFYFLQGSFIAKKKVAQWVKNNPELVGEREVQIHENELNYLTSNSRTHYNLATFHKVEEKKDYIFLFNGKASAVVIPKRAFEDEAQKDEFMSKFKFT